MELLLKKFILLIKTLVKVSTLKFVISNPQLITSHQSPTQKITFSEIAGIQTNPQKYLINKSMKSYNNHLFFCKMLSHFSFCDFRLVNDFLL